MVGAGVRGQIHRLDRKVDPLARRVGILRHEDFLFPQDRRFAFNEQTGALGSVGDHGISENEAFAGFEFNLECHGFPAFQCVIG